MKARLVIVDISLMLVSIAACKDEAPNPDTQPDLRPVIDQPPYLCDLVPLTSLRRVIGLTDPIHNKWAGPQTDNGLCLGWTSDQEAPLGLNWSYNDGDKIVRFQKEKWAGRPTYSVPKSLGKGVAVKIPTSGAIERPNYIVAVFNCGRERPWIRIDFASVVRGRDAVQDMFAFMRIAQKRFGELHKCTPKPS